MAFPSPGNTPKPMDRSVEHSRPARSCVLSEVAVRPARKTLTASSAGLVMVRSKEERGCTGRNEWNSVALTLNIRGNRTACYCLETLTFEEIT
jgi:hypothetical protein